MPAEIPDGAVIVARAIVNSSLWTMRPEDRVLAITCICKANWKPGRFFDGEKSTDIRRGQFVTSLKKLAKESGLSLKQTRTGLKHLEKCGFLARKSTHAWTLITIPKYDFYQDLNKYSDSVGMKAGTPKGTPPANDGQTSGTRVATIEEGEERKERKEGNKVLASAPPENGATTRTDKEVETERIALIATMGTNGIIQLQGQLRRGELSLPPKIKKAINKREKELK